jgi:hypothetical protein
MRIVLVVLSTFQEYVLQNIVHLKQNGNQDIVVITDRKFRGYFQKYVHTIAMEDLLENYHLMTQSYGQEFRNGFWHWTSFRFYAILAYMKKHDTTNILHLENDVMLFENADNIPFHDTSKILLTMDNNYRCIPGIMYIPNSTVLEQCLNQFDHSLKDMQNWGRICIENKKWVDTLPIAPTFTGQNLSSNLITNYKSYNAIFDAAAIGQYLGGIDPRNTPKPDTKGYVNTECEINYSHFEFVWLFNENNCKSPHVIIRNKDTGLPITIKIFNLHVHSKCLTQFMNYSSVLNPAAKISGELIQSCCDIYLASSIKDFSNPYINSMSDFASKCATLDDKDVVTKIKLAKTIFTFTHLLKTHMSTLTAVLKHMETDFILVCHNSDESFSKSYETALFDSCPTLTKIYTQNLLFPPTEKTRPLPIGIANRMWTHGDMEAWSQPNTPTKKTHLLYYYCDLNTNKVVRENMFQVLKKKGIRMQPCVSYREYVQILQSCEFAICPEGNGIDTHRFWECLYAKTIPVCIRNPLVEYYAQFFPVLLLDCWEEFDMISLTNKYNDSDFYNERMLQIDFYRKQINQISTKYCVSFATENLNDSLNRITTQLYNTKEFDAIIILRPKMFLEQAHKTFWDTHKDFILSNQRGYGYWIWKPYIIKHVFDHMMNDWDILLWSDAGCEINLLQEKPFSVLWKTTYADKIVGSFNRPEIEWTKRDAFIFLEMDQNKEAYDTNQHQASVISFCKTPSTSTIVNIWFQTCSTQYNLLDDSPSKNTKRGPFREHRHDQSIFSLLTKKFKVYSGKSIEDISPVVINRNRGANTSIQIGQWKKLLYIMTPTVETNFKQLPDCITNGGLTFAISRDNQLKSLTQYILNGDEHKYTNGNGLPNIIDGIGGTPKLDQDHKIFSIIRNPYEMLYLLYKNQFGSSGDHKQSIKHMKTFEEFIEKYCESDWPYPGGFPCPYLKLSLNQQLLDHNNKCIAHVILFHEDAEKGLALLKEKNPKINLNKIIIDRTTSDYKKHYNEKMISQVRNKCAKELETYNYSFHGHHGSPVYTPHQIETLSKKHTRTTNVNGRLGNQIIRNLAVSAIATKQNLFVEYSNFDLITSLGIPLFVGERINEGITCLNDTNFFTMLNLQEGKLDVNLDAMSAFFQTREISLHLYNYLQTIKNKIRAENQFKFRYQKNNDCFVHIRLGDMAETNPGLAFYENCLNTFICDKIFISSDEPGHEIVKKLLKEYPNAILFDATEKSTIQFGSTCKHVVLSQGSFSAVIGWLSFFSNVYVSDNMDYRWFGDMFSIPGWERMGHV